MTSFSKSRLAKSFTIDTELRLI
jgi:serine/threonine-protein kinase SRPK3